MINTVELGKTGLQLSKIGLGSWQFSKRGLSNLTWKNTKDDEIYKIIQTAVHGGINWFDTAQMYGNGISESFLSTGLVRAKVNNPIIMTKWNPYFKQADDINKSIHERIKNLSPYNITVYQIHNTHSFSSISEQMDAMASLVKCYKTKYIGVSNFSAKQMITANKRLQYYGMKLVSNQVRFNLLKRDIETNDILDVARELGISIIVYSPLEKGLLSGKFHINPLLINDLPLLRKIKFKWLLDKTNSLINVLLSIALHNECSISDVVMSWTVNIHKDILVLSGASQASQMDQNIRAVNNIKLSPSEMDQINIESKKIRLLYV